MFGKNLIRGVDRSDGQKLFIQEVFYTIQGEGPLAGEPAVFIRVAGCNLACHFCDTEFESGMDQRRQSVEDILQKVLQAMVGAGFEDGSLPGLVVLTGGEPLRQNIAPLIHALLHAGVVHVQIETAGTVWQDSLDTFWEPQLYARVEDVTIVCSPKTGKVNPEIQKHCRDWKYIVRAEDEQGEDGLPMMSTQVKGKRQALYRPNMCHAVWLQPCDEQDPIKNKANQDLVVKLCLYHKYRLCLQIHKLVGLP